MEEILRELEAHDERNRVLEHPFFRLTEQGNLSRDVVLNFISQYWHPLHYFPTFLSRLVSEIPHLGLKTSVSRILFQELGEGNVQRAHERFFIETMTDAGFDQHEFVGTAPLESTRRLVECYERSAREWLRGLGALYGTEVTDLALVSGIGATVSKFSGKTSLPWVDIHVLQEPDHVGTATETVSVDLTPDDLVRIVEGAAEMWTCWEQLLAELTEASGLAARSGTR